MELIKDFLKEIRKSLDDKYSIWDTIEISVFLLFYKYLSEYFCERIKNIGEGWEKVNWKEQKIKDYEFWKDSKWIRNIGYFIKPESLFDNLKKIENLIESYTEIKNNFQQISYQNKNFSNKLICSSAKHPIKNIFDRNLQEKMKKHFIFVENVFSWIKTNINENNYKELIHQLADALIKESGKKNEGNNIENSTTEPKLIKLLIENIKLKCQETPKNVYDPECRTGQLLIELHKTYKSKKTLYFGEDNKEKYSKLCAINMIMNNINIKKININDTSCIKENYKPAFLPEKQFDVIVSDIRKLKKSDTIRPKENKEKEWEIIEKCILEQLNENGSAGFICDPIILENKKLPKHWSTYASKYLNTIIPFKNKVILIFTKNRIDQNINVLKNIDDVEKILDLCKNPRKTDDSFLVASDILLSKNNLIIEELIKNSAEEIIVENQQEWATMREICGEENICRYLINKTSENDESKDLWINAENLQKAIIKDSDIKLEVLEKKYYKCSKGDILINKNNAAIYMGDKGAEVSTGVFVIKYDESRTNRINYEYLTYFLRSKNIKKQMEKVGKNLDKWELKEMKIYVPDIKTQNEIAETITNWDEQIANLEALKESIWDKYIEKNSKNNETKTESKKWRFWGNKK